MMYTLLIAPGAPTNLTPLSVTSTSIQFSWNQPDSEEVNGVLRRYTIYWTEKQGGSRSSDFVDGNITVFTITGLKKYFEYTLQVSATTNTEGDRSEPLDVRTREDS